MSTQLRVKKLHHSTAHTTTALIFRSSLAREQMTNCTHLSVLSQSSLTGFFAVACRVLSLACTFKTISGTTGSFLPSFLPAPASTLLELDEKKRGARRESARASECANENECIDAMRAHLRPSFHARARRRLLPPSLHAFHAQLRRGRRRDPPVAVGRSVILSFSRFPSRMRIRGWK